MKAIIIKQTDGPDYATLLLEPGTNHESAISAAIASRIRAGLAKPGATYEAKSQWGALWTFRHDPASGAVTADPGKQ